MLKILKTAPKKDSEKEISIEEKSENENTSLIEGDDSFEDKNTQIDFEFEYMTQVSEKIQKTNLLSPPINSYTPFKDKGRRSITLNYHVTPEKPQLDFESHREEDEELMDSDEIMSRNPSSSSSLDHDNNHKRKDILSIKTPALRKIPKNKQEKIENYFVAGFERLLDHMKKTKKNENLFSELKILKKKIFSLTRTTFSEHLFSRKQTLRDSMFNESKL